MPTVQSPIHVLDKMLALNLNVSLWSARKKLTLADVEHIPNNDLPPQDLATLGSKRIAPPESLRVFATLKARAVTMLDRYGVRFMSGWAIPENLADTVMQELAQIRAEFNLEKENFLNTYDSLVHDWVDKHSEWKEMLARSIDSPSYVRSRMGFSWQLYRVQSSQKGVDSGLEQAVEGLGDTLFNDIVKSADDAWRKVYEGKNRVTHKALSPLRTLEQKLVGLSFVEPHILPVAQTINATLARMPKRGNINGTDLLAVQGLICLMRDKEALLSHARKLIDGQNMDTMLDGLLHQSQQCTDTVESTLQKAAYVDVYDPTAPAFVGEIHDNNPLNSPVIADSLGLW